uniref:Cytochrome b5 heme-binding domain-containing protein n=1 Tax=Percolomonas cosmopolitus TaxID=63605 RepID=A0A7S1PK30_9EUKA|mmetsp:Transcript_7962/g.29673  ORF Transcript_7962/g.29673 Transcript_7962/m.29673 type:complete len:377 (+) Transcript_7962:235-1365(+)|eukprot:CAMPEP_0117436352 /NCGR_PEP_ID=MMETSP0759-20121206/963_1 /TAXON_ID=63605 /ORGANISM="Percolomonas cosmopolitus, Strain WS" /LENGTH=376 /DNA_ID=CAMNT_0005227949 /DNA_START=169 /DNA_END=1299 /DNA_ORIENTATION=-
MGNICGPQHAQSRPAPGHELPSNLYNVYQQSSASSGLSEGTKNIPQLDAAKEVVSQQETEANLHEESSPKPVLINSLPIEDQSHPLASRILIIVGHKVYDVTDYPHPGGLNPLLANRDTDCSVAFTCMHLADSSCHETIARLYIGDMASCPAEHRGCPMPFFNHSQESIRSCSDDDNHFENGPPEESLTEDHDTRVNILRRTSTDPNTQSHKKKSRKLRPRCPRMASKSDLFPELRIDQTNMFDKLGFEKIKQLSAQFYKHVFEDEEASFFLELFTQPREEVIYNSYTFFVERFGGPSLDARGSYLCCKNGMINSHSEFPFSKEYQDFWLNNMSRSMKEVDIHGEDYDILNEYFEAAMKQLVEGLGTFHAMKELKE